jgi:hypothetical protein
MGSETSEAPFESVSKNKKISLKAFNLSVDVIEYLQGDGTSCILEMRFLGTV